MSVKEKIKPFLIQWLKGSVLLLVAACTLFLMIKFSDQTIWTIELIGKIVGGLFGLVLLVFVPWLIGGAFEEWR